MAQHLAQTRSIHMNAKHASSGFTLIELLVAISIMALMAVISWRGLEGMFTSQRITKERSDNVQALQTALGQWGADLDAIQTVPNTIALDWDGQVLRITRSSRLQPDEGPIIVAWTRRTDPNQAGGGLWLRWQSPPLRSQGQWQQAWQQAAQWARTPGDAERRTEVALMPLQNWQVFYHRGGAWSNPLSSSGIGFNGALPGFTGNNGGNTVPDGVRLQITLPPGQALSGTITRDWVSPTLTTGQP